MKRKIRVDKHLYELEVTKARIAKLIIKYRIEKKLNQTELAKRVGVSQQQISKIENGEFSSIMTVAKVLLALGYFLDMKPVKLRRKVASRLQVA